MATHSRIPAWRIPMDRGAWRATVLRVTKSRTQLKRLSTHEWNIYNQLTLGPIQLKDIKAKPEVFLKKELLFKTVHINLILTEYVSWTIQSTYHESRQSFAWNAFGLKIQLAYAIEYIPEYDPTLKTLYLGSHTHSLQGDPTSHTVHLGTYNHSLQSDLVPTLPRVHMSTSPGWPPPDPAPGVPCPQSLRWPHRTRACLNFCWPLDFTFTSPCDHVNQFLKLSLSIHTHTHTRLCGYSSLQDPGLHREHHSVSAHVLTFIFPAFLGLISGDQPGQWAVSCSDGVICNPSHWGARMHSSPPSSTGRTLESMCPHINNILRPLKKAVQPVLDYKIKLNIVLNNWDFRFHLLYNQCYIIRVYPILNNTLSKQEKKKKSGHGDTNHVYWL